MQRIAFSTDELPAHLDAGTRIAYWRDFSDAYYGKLDVEGNDNTPFSIHFSFVPFGRIGLGEFCGTITRSTRRHNAAMEGTFVLGINGGDEPFLVKDAGAETWLDPRSMILLAGDECGELRARSNMKWLSLCVPSAHLAERIARSDDLVGRVAAANRPATQHLFRYLDMLRRPDVSGGTDEVNARVGDMIVDLVVLAFSEPRTNADGARGLRASRTQLIMREIDRRFADPAFSAAHVARKIGITQRYVQDLLHETGATFTERVNELRLQKARQMLAATPNDGMRISEIALAAGFSDVSYFNRCFRRRFGTTPRLYRSAG